MKKKTKIIIAIITVIVIFFVVFQIILPTLYVYFSGQMAPVSNTGEGYFEIFLGSKLIGDNIVLTLDSVYSSGDEKWEDITIKVWVAEIASGSNKELTEGVDFEIILPEENTIKENQTIIVKPIEGKLSNYRDYTFKIYYNSFETYIGIEYFRVFPSISYSVEVSGNNALITIMDISSLTELNWNEINYSFNKYISLPESGILQKGQTIDIEELTAGNFYMFYLADETENRDYPLGEITWTQE